MNYQLSRRYFLLSAALASTQLLSGCSNVGTIFQVLFLENSIPPQLFRDFKRSLDKSRKIDFQPETQLLQIFKSLVDVSNKTPEPESNSSLFKILGKSITYPNLVTLGDAWLSSAIARNLIQPLTIEEIANWQKLPADWQQLVRRNSQGFLDGNGKIYGAPYRWGSTVIAYNREKLDELGITLQDWGDLWQTELRDRLSLLDSPREVIGLTLKKLGQSYNSENLDLPNLETELLALHRQAKLYSSNHYLESLVLGDTWAAVAWSSDILPLLKRYPEIEFIIPQSGTSLWADLWVKPQVETAASEAGAQLVEAWINYCWQSQAAKQISLFTPGISPILSALKPNEIPQDLQDNVFLDSAMLNSAKNEFLLPLSAKTAGQYRDLWLKMRQSGDEA